MDLYYTDLAQRLRTAGQDLGDLDRDLSEVLWFFEAGPKRHGKIKSESERAWNEIAFVSRRLGVCWNMP